MIIFSLKIKISIKEKSTVKYYYLTLLGTYYDVLTVNFNNNSIYSNIKTNNTQLVPTLRAFPVLYVCKTKTRHVSVASS